MRCCRHSRGARWFPCCTVLNADDQSDEYINCHAGSGLMNGLGEV